MELQSRRAVTKFSSASTSPPLARALKWSTMRVATSQTCCQGNHSKRTGSHLLRKSVHPSLFFPIVAIPPSCAPDYLAEKDHRRVTAYCFTSNSALA